MHLSGGARAKNIFWQVAGRSIIHANAGFEGIILCKTAITQQTNASMTGRALAQSQVALDKSGGYQLKALRKSIIFLVLVIALLPGCGKHLVEFPLDGAATGDGNSFDAHTDSTVAGDAVADSPDAADAKDDASTDALSNDSADAADAKEHATTDVLSSDSSDAADTNADAIVDVSSSDSADVADIKVDAGADSPDSASDIDLSAPKVIATSPTDGAKNVPINTKATAIFSKVMNPLTINDVTFTLSQGATLVPGAVTYDGATNTAIFTPTKELALGLPYQATITTGAKDTGGSALVADNGWSFTTGACGQAPIVLLSAANFAVLAGATVTNTGITNVGLSTIVGDLGVSPGTAVTGFPPGLLYGNKHAGDPVAAQANADLTTAYNDAAGRTLCPVTVAGNIGGQTLAPGLYKSTSSLQITSGDLTLDAQGDPNGIFIFQIASTLTTTAGRQVILSGGAKAVNIFWQVGTSATFGTTSVFKGTVMADQAITMKTGATMDGRLLARIAAVTLDTNSVVKPAP